MISQAYVPEGAEVMPNRNGPAPGLHISHAPKLGDRHIFMLPGPPAEALPMFESSVIPALRRLAPSSLHTEILYSAGLPESKVEERVVAITGAPREISLAYCASPESVKIFVSSEDRECARKHADSIRREMSAHILSHGSRTISEEILKILSAKGLTRSVAESCTGGLIASEITEIAGSSSVFKGGAVTYSNSLKNSILGVGERTLLEHGAVSAECARQMAAGAAAKFASDTAIAVTGIAGPGGGSEEKPVGLVFIATSVGKDTVVTENRFRGNRSMIRRRSVATAFNQIRNQLSA
jgi:nicotinamide-nucleotide amidase